MTNKQNISLDITESTEQELVIRDSSLNEAASILSLDKNETKISPEQTLTDKESPNKVYQLIELIGQGGLGKVYRAYDKENKTEFAVKVLHPHMLNNQTVVKRFLQESDSVSKLTHPNIVSIYSHGITSKNEPYLLMDYVKGTSLADKIKTFGPLNKEIFVEIFVQICDAISYAHEHHVIHRDIKPSNIMLLESDSKNTLVKIIDFGIAKLIPVCENQEQRMTQTGDILGSPIYMSPEQCTGQRVSTSSDIYALGCVMYEAISGKPPFIGDNIIQTILKHLKESPKKIVESKLEKADLEYFEKVICRCLEKDPLKRYQSVEELKENILLCPGLGSKIQQKKLQDKQKKRQINQIQSKYGRSIFILLSLSMILISSILINQQIILDKQNYEFALSQMKIERLNYTEPKRLLDLYNQAINLAHKLHKPDKEILLLEYDRYKHAGFVGTKEYNKKYFNEQSQILQKFLHRLAKYPSVSEEYTDCLSRIRSLKNSEIYTGSYEKQNKQTHDNELSQFKTEVEKKLLNNNTEQNIVLLNKLIVDEDAKYSNNTYDHIKILKIKLGQIYLNEAVNTKDLIKKLIFLKYASYNDESLKNIKLINETVKLLANQYTQQQLSAEIDKAYIEGELFKAFAFSKVLDLKTTGECFNNQFLKWLNDPMYHSVLIKSEKPTNRLVYRSKPELSKQIIDLLKQKIAFDQNMIITNNDEKSTHYEFYLLRDLLDLAENNFAIGNYEESEKISNEILSSLPNSFLYGKYQKEQSSAYLPSLQKRNEGFSLEELPALKLKLEVLINRNEWAEADNLVFQLIPNEKQIKKYISPFFSNYGSIGRASLAHWYWQTCDLHGRHDQAKKIRQAIVQAQFYDGVTNKLQFLKKSYYQMRKLDEFFP